MLITGAILAACVKRFNMVKVMLGIGVVGGIAAVAAPGVILMTGNSLLGVALTIFFLVMYTAVFFPSYNPCLQGQPLKEVDYHSNQCRRLRRSRCRVDCVIYAPKGQTG